MHLRRHPARRLPGLPTPGKDPADIRDLLSSVSERPDLERLFDRKVTLSQILRLAGRGIGHDRIVELLGSPDPSGDLKRLLDS
jgi:hypothetical protein